MQNKLYLLCLIMFMSTLFISANLDAQDEVVTNQIWTLKSKSNKLIPQNSEVLYYFSSDAYSTFNARKFSDWDYFSIVDSRNLRRLDTGDRIEILGPKYQSKIYEVRLLDGFEKGRSFYIITEDLLKDYVLN